MKSMKSKMVMMLILLLLAGTAVNAQGSGEKTHGIAGLSEDQKAQIHKLRISHLKDVQALRNQVRENRAHFKTLMTSENPDMNAINKNIDEFGGIRSQLMKKQAAHIQDIRKLLNDEQRLIFDRKVTENGQAVNIRHGKMNSKDESGASGWRSRRHMIMSEGQQ